MRQVLRRMLQLEMQTDGHHNTVLEVTASTSDLNAVDLHTISVVNIESQSTADALDPKRFKDLVSSVHKICGFCHDTSTYNTPSLALKLGHTLKKCAVMLISEALQTRSKEMEEKATAFIRLCNIEWTEQISSRALKTLHDMKLNRPTILPLADNITKMTHCLSEKAADTTKQLHFHKVMHVVVLHGSRYQK